MLPIVRLRPQSLLAIAPLAVATSLHADPTTYHYAGDLTPSEGVYKDWFTTVGPNTQGISYFDHTTWSSDGNVLAMNTSISPSEAIWFGVGHSYGDSPGITLANGDDGNWVRMRVALSPGATDWSLNWHDASGFVSSLYLKSNGFEYFHDGATHFYPVADMTAFHTFTTYSFFGFTAYYFDYIYVGGGSTRLGTPNFFLLGDGSATDVSGTGTLYVDYLTIITAVGDSPLPPLVPEPATFATLGGLAALGFAARLRSRRP